MKKITDRFYQTLGLCRRAGKLVTGTWAAENLIRKQKAELVIVSADASDRTKQKMLKLCKNNRVDMIIISSKEELSRSVGQYERAIIAINDKRFKAMILDALSNTLKANPGVIHEWQR